MPLTPEHEKNGLQHFFFLRFKVKIIFMLNGGFCISHYRNEV